MKPRTLPLVTGLAVVLLAVTFWAGTRLGRSGAPGPDATSASATSKTYYCSMHPRIRLPTRGRCPICDMDLIPLPETGVDPGPDLIRLTPRARKLAEIETARVERQAVQARVSLAGKVDFDETRVRTIPARVAGRLDRLYVNYTGVSISKNDHLADIYSPSLYTAQQQLLDARKAVERPETEASEFLRQSTRATLEALRDKLRLLGLSAEQIAEIENKERPSEHLLISSDLAGVITEKMASEGDYVQEGDPIYRVADLSQLWVKLEAYETDLPWLRFGQRVTFDTEAHPGQEFEGKITFIDPIVHPRKRTVAVRLNVDNSEHRLKPGMLVRGRALSELVEGGKVADPALAGKWVSPMHSEVIKDGPGDCDVCGMALVPAEKLFNVASPDAIRPLVIPASAALITGQRALVFVRQAGGDLFERREVSLGPRAGDHYVVLEGLTEGEEVVTRGNFKIDSSFQIQGKASMMQPRDHDHTGHGHGEAEQKLIEDPGFHRRLDALISAYLGLQKALAADDLAASRQALDPLGQALAELETAPKSESAAPIWKEEQAELGQALAAAREANDIAGLRVAFESLSQSVIVLERRFGHSVEPLRRIHCSMAFDNRGARWLQAEGTIANPYFGSTMLRCGDVEASHPPRPGVEEKPAEKSKDEEPHDHEHPDDHEHPAEESSGERETESSSPAAPPEKESGDV